MSDRSVKEQIITWIVNRAVKLANRNVDVGALQARHNAHAGRITRMTVKDLKRSWHFRVQGGRFEYLEDPADEDVDGGFETTSDTLIAIATGKRKVMDPASGKVFDADFTPLHALTRGDLRVWGDAATNDALLFTRHIAREVWPHLRDEMRASASARAVAES